MRTWIWCLGGLTFAAIPAVSVVAEAVTSPGQEVVQGEFGAKIDDYMTRLAGFGFSGVALVAKNDEVILRKAYGPADRSTKRPATVETPFTIGSITKQFTAAAIMKLQAQGRLDVADRVTKFFPDVPPDKSQITIHHLLTHTAGLPDASGDDYEAATRDDLVQVLRSCKLRSKPGEHFAYSNVGFSLLGGIVEIVSGQPYEAFLAEHLFKPAGMSRTGYLLPKFRPSDLPHGYTEDGDWGTSLDHPWMPDGPSWHLRANGGILSTVDDMYRWHLALSGDAVLPAEARERMFTPYVPEGPAGRSHYGYGWTIAKTLRGTKVIMQLYCIQRFKHVRHRRQQRDRADPVRDGVHAPAESRRR